ERARVALARLLISPGSLLLMDEPSNHLDLESSEALAESLRTFDGTLIFVSHNRSLVRTLASKIWNVENGNVETYPGTLDEYVDSCQRRLNMSDASPANGTAPKKPSRDPERQKKREDAVVREKRKRLLESLHRRVARLEGRIAELETEQKRVHGEMAEPEAYR